MLARSGRSRSIVEFGTSFGVADNADRSPEYLARIRESDDYLSVPFAADVELSMRL